jgi:hypothetical protein
MTERAHALGGTLSAGPRADGGFRVVAWLPAREEAAAEPPEPASATMPEADRSAQ